MVGLCTYQFKMSNTDKITPEESFTNDYTEELYESEHVLTANKQLHVILYAKDEKEDLHNVMETKCQHLIEKKRKEFIKLLQKLKSGSM